MNKNEQVYKIDPKGKYVIFLGSKDGKRIEDASGFQKQLAEWWFSEDPFIILAPYGGITMRFERVDDTVLSQNSEN